MFAPWKMIFTVAGGLFHTNGRRWWQDSAQTFSEEKVDSFVAVISSEFVKSPWKPSFKTNFSQSLEDRSHESCDWWTFHSGDLHVFFMLLLHYTSSALNCSGTVWHMQRNCVAAVSSPQGSFSHLHQCFTAKKREASCGDTFYILLSL